MQHAPRHNHRWQRALAWVCLLLASATAVPIGVSFVNRWRGVVLDVSPVENDVMPTLALVRGSLVRVPLIPADHITVFPEHWPDSAMQAAQRTFGPLSPWSTKWSAEKTLLLFVIPLWWVPITLLAAGLLLNFCAGGFFARRRLGGKMVIAAALLSAANAALAPPVLVHGIWTKFWVPVLSIPVQVVGGSLLVSNGVDPDEEVLREYLRRTSVNSRGNFPSVFVWWSTDVASAAGWVGGVDLWWLNIALGAALLWIGTRAYRRGRDPDACSACGYSLVGLASTTCPECGVARKEATTALPIAREV